MPLTRKILADLGVPKEHIDAIMGSRDEILEGYFTKSDADKAAADAVTKALDEAKKTAPDITKHPDYIKLQETHEGFKKRTEARASEDFKGVKGKFFDQVYDKLDHTKDLKEQLAKIKTDFGEFFDDAQQQTPPPAATNPGFNPPPGGATATGIQQQIDAARETGNMPLVASLIRQQAEQATKK
jgi:hypothetical protein